MRAILDVFGTYPGGEASIQVNLPPDAIEEIFDDEFGGWCAICRDRKVEGNQDVCCECLDTEIRWHTQNCLCQEEDDK